MIEMQLAFALWLGPVIAAVPAHDPIVAAWGPGRTNMN
jgi:hypothetical protein